METDDYSKFAVNVQACRPALPLPVIFGPPEFGGSLLLSSIGGRERTSALFSDQKAGRAQRLESGHSGLDFCRSRHTALAAGVWSGPRSSASDDGERRRNRQRETGGKGGAGKVVADRRSLPKFWLPAGPLFAAMGMSINIFHPWANRMLPSWTGAM